MDRSEVALKYVKGHKMEMVGSGHHHSLARERLFVIRPTLDASFMMSERSPVGVGVRAG